MSKERDVFAVLGVLPEPNGYSLAKFSRGYPCQSYRDWVIELTSEGAEKFYDTYYFDYGHTSIADMAHVTVVVENISTVARMTVIDEQLMDVQECSTRYVDFSGADYEVPPEVEGTEIEPEYRRACEYLFERYRYYYDQMVEFLAGKYLASKPDAMSQDKAQRTFNARAFDEARYCLPCSFHTGLGFIVSARTLERMIKRFNSHRLQEVRNIGADLRKAIQEEPAYSPHFEEFAVPALPTLVKYADRNDYLAGIYGRIRTFAEKNLADQLPEVEEVRSVELLSLPQEDDLDLVVSLLYRVLPHSYNQIAAAVRDWPKEKQAELIDLVYEGRSKRDPLIRELATGRLTYDVCFDNGAFRDLHRHRNMIHIFKDLTGQQGFDVPYEMGFSPELAEQFQADMARNLALAAKLEEIKPGLGEYVLPLAARRKVLFRLDPWELQYLTELRTTPKGNWSYRETAYKMYSLFKEKAPLRAKHFQVTPPADFDFWDR